jgi:hypothetical protein
MRVPTYDIFSGTGYQDAKWLEAVEGLSAACERMKHLADQMPGPYFVFSTDSKAVLAAIDTTKPRAAQERAAS